ncbi:MAG TPA: winged helix-turn-helix domain-containing protein [Roseiflexaceae bacterium]|nr:winged helix-turn-helix domain-containing protein [Roseiflexaceae bacterium]
MSVSIGELLSRQTTARFYGRARELEVMRQLLEPGGPLVLHVHGIGGIGKSRLLDAFAAQACARGAAVVRLDCRSIEPTERGFLQELAGATGAAELAFHTVVQQLGALGDRVVLALDTYESFRLLDAWLRQVFIPALESHVRVALVGREPPTSAWVLAPAWQGLFRTLTLEGLDDSDALELLARANLSPADARSINRVARGHPLALSLATATALGRASIGFGTNALQRVLAQLTRLYLADTHDPLTREALQAAAVVRRSTISLLRAMLPGIPAREAYERLKTLPFVETGRDGLLIHDIVQEALAADLRAADPNAYREYRRAAWQQLRTEVQVAGPAELWRYTADMLYLLEAPLVREVFFPSGTTPYAVEPARPEDYAAIRAISLQHDGPAASELLDHWWCRQPQAFFAVRDRTNDVAGFYCLLRRSLVSPADAQADPVTQAWWAHLRHDALEAGEETLLLRLCLTREHGRRHSPKFAALVLDLKRTYMELRPQLRRMYTAAPDLSIFDPFLTHVGFRPLASADAEVGGVHNHMTLLDFGPGSVDGWLANLVAAELKPAGEASVTLDVDSHELMVDGQRIGLTKLEFAVLRYLSEREGKAVPRGDLLEDVWGYSYEGGSNVVDVVVRSLRKKLGVRAAALETVTKVGYRFRRV